MKRLALATFVALCLSASPALGATFTVNTNGDQSDANTGTAQCDVDTGTPLDQCTLRAAIQQSNASTSVDDLIHFNLGIANLTISPATALPDITDTVTIEGDTEPSYANLPV